MVYIAITNIIRYNLSMIGELIMKKIIIVFIVVVLFLSGCANSSREDDKKLTLYDVDKEIYLEPLANYQDYFTEAIDYVKSIDNKFDVNDYVLSYSNISRISSDETQRLIYLKYSLDNNKVLTNKNYTVEYQNGKIVNNLEVSKYNDEVVDIDEIRNKISKFEADKANIVYKKFKDIYDDVPILDNGNITIGNSKYLASKNMVTFEEHYNYNFDSKKLVYKLSIIYEDNLGGFGFEREIGYSSD